MCVCVCVCVCVCMCVCVCVFFHFHICHIDTLFIHKFVKCFKHPVTWLVTVYTGAWGGIRGQINGATEVSDDATLPESLPADWTNRRRSEVSC